MHATEVTWALQVWLLGNPTWQLGPRCLVLVTVLVIVAWDWGIARGVDGGCAKGRVNAVLPSWLVGTSSHTVRPDNAMRICDAVGVGVNSLHNGVGVVLHLYFQ